MEQTIKLTKGEVLDAVTLWLYEKGLFKKGYLTFGSVVEDGTTFLTVKIKNKGGD